LKAKGCATPYDGKNFQISATSPYEISVGTDDKEGYDETACIVCGNDY